MRTESPILYNSAMTTKIENNELQNIELVDDKALAGMLNMSVSWVRQERSKRLKKLPHNLNIDPIYVASSPRYRFSDVENWINGLAKEAHG